MEKEQEKMMHVIPDNELKHVVGGNMTVNLTVPPDRSAADYILYLLKAQPQLAQSKDKLMDIAAAMDSDGKKVARLEFDRNYRLVCVSIG